MSDQADLPEKLDHLILASGQIWIPTRGHRGKRLVIKADRRLVAYQLIGGSRRNQWTWQFENWLRNQACILAPRDVDA